MRQLGITAAIGGYTVGAFCTQARAAEWSVAPTYNAFIDFDTNRQLRTDSTAADSGSALLGVDLRFQRALEHLIFTLEPNYQFRRFTDRSYGNGDNRTVTAGMAWNGERTTFNLNASYLDQSTLTTETLETGLLVSDTFQHDITSSLNWTWNQTERRQLITQLSYSAVDYSGHFQDLLPGYKYFSGSVGERFIFDELTSVTLGTYGDKLVSPIPGESSHEVGLQAELIHQFSERIDLDASVGGSRRVLGGASSFGTTASVSLSRSWEREKLSLQYLRSLVPYGTGLLVERQQYSGTLTHSFSEYLDGNLSYTQVHNNETAVLLRLDRRGYSDLNVNLTWRPLKMLSVTLRGDAIRSQLIDLAGDEVKEWRASLGLTWFPHPLARSW